MSTATINEMIVSFTLSHKAVATPKTDLGNRHTENNGPVKSPKVPAHCSKTNLDQIVTVIPGHSLRGSNSNSWNSFRCHGTGT